MRLGDDLIPVLAIVVGAALGVVATASLVLRSPSENAAEVALPAAPVATVLPTHRIFASGGDGQVGEPTSLLPVRLAVMVVDEAGDPIPGAEVRFEVASGGGAVAPSRTRTDSLGRAFSLWRMGGTPGIQEVSARTSGLPSAARFTATARHRGERR